jgi:hypothetical protein
VPVHEESFVLSPETDARLQSTLTHIKTMFPNGEIVGIERRVQGGLAMCVLKVKV